MAAYLETGHSQVWRMFGIPPPAAIKKRRSKSFALRLDWRT
jgi:hypothetical protein